MAIIKYYYIISILYYVYFVYKYNNVAIRNKRIRQIKLLQLEIRRNTTV